MKKIISVAILLVTIASNLGWSKSIPANKNFNNRFEYVISILEHITEYEEDISLGLTLIVDEKKTHFIYIGIKELFNILYNDEYKNKDQLYFSVGKVFLRDTLNISQTKLSLFEKHIIDPMELDKIEKSETFLSECCKESKLKNNLTWKEKNLIGYYFDRKFYPVNSIHNGNNVINWGYCFKKNNLIQILKGEKIYNQIYDENGNFIQEEEGL